MVPCVDSNLKPNEVDVIASVGDDGTTDDLLTAGLGKTGLGSATGPTYANPTSPAPGELRRAAIYSNYRALVDPTAAGGYGTLHGPNVDANGVVTAGEGRIAGIEYTAYTNDLNAGDNVTLVVQVPSNFDRNNPCIESATSSGSRGVYGAISSAEWGLKGGCIVALTDKGTGAQPGPQPPSRQTRPRPSWLRSTPRHPTASLSSTRTHSAIPRRTEVPTRSARSSSRSTWSTRPTGRCAQRARVRRRSIATTPSSEHRPRRTAAARRSQQPNWIRPT